MTNAKSMILRVAAACLMLFSGAGAAALDLSTVPLYLKASGVASNIYLTLDDSGSMAWAFMPDSLCSSYPYNRFESSSFNPMYYDPTVTYQPPIGADGSSLGNVPFTAAWIDGYNHSAGVVDLATEYKATGAYYGPGKNYNVPCSGRLNWETGSGPGAAYYYQHISGSACVNDTTNSCYKREVVSTAAQRSEEHTSELQSH